MTEERSEIETLVDELVAKAGPTVGQIKKDQDPEKVARLLELGWTPEEKGLTLEARVRNLEEMIVDHENRIHQCSIQR